MTLLITNARIASENSPTLAGADVLLSEGEIEKIGQGITAPDEAHVIDAAGSQLAAIRNWNGPEPF